MPMSKFTFKGSAQLAKIIREKLKEYTFEKISRVKVYRYGTGKKIRRIDLWATDNPAEKPTTFAEGVTGEWFEVESSASNRREGEVAGRAFDESYAKKNPLGLSDRKAKTVREGRKNPSIFHFDRRKYGRKTYTWAYAEVDGQKYNLGDPWPGVKWPKKELDKALKIAMERPVNRAKQNPEGWEPEARKIHRKLTAGAVESKKLHKTMLAKMSDADLAKRLAWTKQLGSEHGDRAILEEINRRKNPEGFEPAKTHPERSPIWEANDRLKAEGEKRAKADLPNILKKVLSGHYGHTVSNRNMIKALEIHPWQNTVDDWQRYFTAKLIRRLSAVKNRRRK